MDGTNKTAEDIIGELQDLRQIIADFKVEDKEPYIKRLYREREKQIDQMLSGRSKG